MSITNLKRISETKYFNKVSSNETQFSINGGHRNSGWVGQTNLSRSVRRTPYSRHGQPLGSNSNNIIHNSGTCSANDPTIIKSSVKTTSGLINTKYKWTKRGYPYTIVQPDDNMNRRDNDSQGLYIENLKMKNTCVSDNETASGNKPCLHNKKCSKFIGSTKKPALIFTKKLKGMDSQSIHLDNLKKKCGNITSWPPRTNNDGRGCPN